METVGIRDEVKDVFKSISSVSIRESGNEVFVKLIIPRKDVLFLDCFKGYEGISVLVVEFLDNGVRRIIRVFATGGEVKLENCVRDAEWEKCITERGDCEKCEKEVRFKARAMSKMTLADDNLEVWLWVEPTQHE